jgi:hypothetical protein
MDCVRKATASIHKRLQTWDTAPSNSVERQRQIQKSYQANSKSLLEWFGELNLMSLHRGRARIVWHSAIRDRQVLFGTKCNKTQGSHYSLKSLTDAHNVNKLPACYVIRKLYYRVHRSSPEEPNRSHVYPGYVSTTCFFNMISHHCQTLYAFHIFPYLLIYLTTLINYMFVNYIRLKCRMNANYDTDTQMWLI